MFSERRILKQAQNARVGIIGATLKFLPGTGRWQAQPDGGVGLGWGERLEDLECAAGPPLRRFAPPPRSWEEFTHFSLDA